MNDLQPADVSQRLRSIELFNGLADDEYDWLARHGIVRFLSPGEVIIKDGAPGTHFYVLLDGELIATKTINGHEEFLTRHSTPPPPTSHDGKPSSAHQFTGEISLLTDGTSFANVSAVGQAIVLSFPKDVFLRMIARYPSVMRVILPALAWRLRKAEFEARNEVTIGALQTMAAGLAHELNNPVAVVSRAMSELESALPELGQMALDWGTQSVPQERTAVMDTVLTVTANELGSGSDSYPVGAEDEIRDWAQARGAADPDLIAELLAERGITAGCLRDRLAVLRPEVAPAALDYLTSVIAVRNLVTEARIAAPRISSIVSALGGYTNLDRAPQQEFPVTDGLDATLFLMRTQLRNVRVVCEYEPGMPCILGYPSELNQVWTNLIDNAVDAMADGGTLTVRAEHISDLVKVEIGDTGCGIPSASLDRIFQPFYTTKEIGKGTGLGLHLAHSIVTDRHGGSIEVKSIPGDTRISVYLPVRSAPPAGTPVR